MYWFLFLNCVSYRRFKVRLTLRGSDEPISIRRSDFSACRVAANLIRKLDGLSKAEERIEHVPGTLRFHRVPEHLERAVDPALYLTKSQLSGNSGIHLNRVGSQSNKVDHLEGIDRPSKPQEKKPKKKQQQTKEKKKPQNPAPNVYPVSDDGHPQHEDEDDEERIVVNNNNKNKQDSLPPENKEAAQAPILELPTLGPDDDEDEEKNAEYKDEPYSPAMPMEDKEDNDQEDESSSSDDDEDDPPHGGPSISSNFRVSPTPPPGEVYYSSASIIPPTPELTLFSVDHAFEKARYDTPTTPSVGPAKPPYASPAPTRPPTTGSIPAKSSPIPKPPTPKKNSPPPSPSPPGPATAPPAPAHLPTQRPKRLASEKVRSRVQVALDSDGEDEDDSSYQHDSNLVLEEESEEIRTSAERDSSGKVPLLIVLEDKATSTLPAAKQRKKKQTKVKKSGKRHQNLLPHLADGYAEKRLEDLAQPRNPLPAWYDELFGREYQIVRPEFSGLPDWQTYHTILAVNNLEASQKIMLGCLKRLLYIAAGRQGPQPGDSCTNLLFQRSPEAIIEFFNNMLGSAMRGATRQNYLRTYQTIVSCAAKENPLLHFLSHEEQRSARQLLHTVNALVARADKAKNREKAEGRSLQVQSGDGGVWVTLETHMVLFRRNLNRLLELIKKPPPPISKKLARRDFIQEYNLRFFLALCIFPNRPSFWRSLKMKHLCRVNRTETGEKVPCGHHRFIRSCHR